MNIFVLDEDPVVSAQLMCDKHVVKMILESAQMLSTAQRVLDGVKEKRPSVSGKRIVDYWSLEDVAPATEKIIYKAVHVKHPCTLWTMESSHNYKWHWKHWKALCQEYTYRYGKTHATEDKLSFQLWIVPRNIERFRGLTELPQAMPDYCKRDDVVEAYQNYYRNEKARFAKWTKREVPHFMLDNSKEIVYN